MAVHLPNMFVGLAFAFGAFVQPALANQPIAYFGCMSGKVLVNSGQGFKVATANGGLKIGDWVLVGKDSLVTLVYDNANCSVSYNSATVISVPAQTPCKPGDTLAAVGGDFVAPVNAAVGAPLAFGLAPEAVGLGAASAIFLTATATTLIQTTPPSVSAP